MKNIREGEKMGAISCMRYAGKDVMDVDVLGGYVQGSDEMVSWLSSATLILLCERAR